QLVRVYELVDALIDREETADREEDDAHHEGVDVTLASVAERMLAVGFASRHAAAHVQQDLVARVGQRVNRLREKGGRPRQQPADELGEGDPHVRDERREYGLAAPMCTHATECKGRRYRGRYGPPTSRNRVRRSRIHGGCD